MRGLGEGQGMMRREERERGTKLNQALCLASPEAPRASVNLHHDKKKTSGYAPPTRPPAPANAAPSGACSSPGWGTDHGRHRLGINRVPFIWLDAAGGTIR